MPILKNARHERAARERVKPGATQGSAYLAAGYKGTKQTASINAWRLFHRPDVVARVTELQAQAAEVAIAESGINRGWVIARLVDAVERAMAAVPVGDRKGKPTRLYRADVAGALRALELIGKELGMFVARSENQTRNYVISGEPLSTEEWIKRHVGPD